MWAGRRSDRRAVPARSTKAAAVSEFDWQFDATFRADGSALHTESRESQSLSSETAIGA